MADTNPWASRLRLRLPPRPSRVAVIVLLTAAILTLLLAARALLLS